MTNTNTATTTEWLSEDGQGTIDMGDMHPAGAVRELMEQCGSDEELVGILAGTINGIRCSQILDDTRYAIDITRHYYAPQPDTTERLTDSWTGEEWSGTLEEAEDKIEEIEAALYECSNGESSRPTLTIVRV